jgi:hypothetical protein
MKRKFVIFEAKKRMQNFAFQPYNHKSEHYFAIDMGQHGTRTGFTPTKPHCSENREKKDQERGQVDII